MRPRAATFRFAPSPNGRLHLGHAYSALLNETLARRHDAALLLRIEDIDPVRSRPELVGAIHADLDWLGLRFPEPARRQSAHMPAYRAALHGLAERGLAYPCFCTRGAIAARAAAEAEAGRPLPRDPDGVPHYPGTCRDLPPEVAAGRCAAGEPHAWRLALDRALAAAPGPHRYRTFAVDGSEGWAMAAPERWGDALIGRRDVPTSYHLAVVHDDAEQAVTHVVRGRDLEAATDLHVLLQALLGLPSPAYHHHALILAPDGTKLAKSKGSPSLADLRAEGTEPAALRAQLGFPATG
ncbi:tRNA glutamyl-Q(34) synthetase GluQRS [Methylobacterium sp. A54F]